MHWDGVEGSEWHRLPSSLWADLSTPALSSVFGKNFSKPSNAEERQKIEVNANLSYTDGCLLCLPCQTIVNGMRRSLTFGWFVSAEGAGHSERALVNPSKSALDQYGLLKDTQQDNTPVTLQIHIWEQKSCHWICLDLYFLSPDWCGYHSYCSVIFPHAMFTNIVTISDMFIFTFIVS